MFDVYCKEVFTVEYLCGLLMDLTVYSKDARTMILTWVPPHRGIIFLLFDMVLRVRQKESIYWQTGLRGQVKKREGHGQKLVIESDLTSLSWKRYTCLGPSP